MGTLQVEPRRLETPAAMTFDEVSMERSKSFVLALQELRNIKPQLYSAAEYCEKSYLHNEQKQMVLDNLKDYAVRALVNAVDHLGTVAYKLTDLFEKQSSDISDVELKISCLGQKTLTCQSYMDKEGLRQQQLLESAPRHHKRYILPNNVHNKMQTRPQQVNGAGQSQSTSKLQCSVSPASKTLSWHLAADSTSTPNKPSHVPSEQDTMPFSYEGSKGYKATPGDFHLLDAVEATEPRPLSPHLQSRDGASHPPLTAPRLFGSLDLLEDPKYFPSFKSSGSPIHREVCRPSARNKGVFSAFFAKNKYPKQKKAYA